MSSNNMKAKVKRQKVKVGKRELDRLFFCLFTFAFCLTLGGCRQDMQDQPRYEVYESSGFFKDGLSSRKPVEGTVARGYLRADNQLYTGKMDKAQANAPGGSSGGNANKAGANQGGEETSSATASTTGGEGGEQHTGTASPAQGAQGNGNSNGASGSANNQGRANAQGAAGGAQAGEDTDADTFPFPVTAEVVARGRERFEIYCAMCHGYTGEGDGMIVRRGYRRPPSYHEDRLRQARVGYFFRVMTEGYGAMPPYRAQVPVQDRWAIAAYIRALQLSQLNQQAAPAHAAGGAEAGGHR